jgi:hypothetical protein
MTRQDLINITMGRVDRYVLMEWDLGEILIRVPVEAIEKLQQDYWHYRPITVRIELEPLNVEDMESFEHAN